MTWGTGRKLPKEWPLIRQAVLARDGHQCRREVAGRRCRVRWLLEVDHIDDPDDHSLDNLQTLCHHHHKAKTQAQAAQAKARKRRTPPPAEPHPGDRRATHR
jgi:5-methylcytosine-specific restriction endonuclease McrA